MSTSSTAAAEDADPDPFDGRDGREAAETAVPAGADPATCTRCGQPFPRSELLALHRGLAHGDHLSPDERAAYDAARREEAAALGVFRLQAIAALVLCYFGFLFAYSVFG